MAAAWVTPRWRRALLIVLLALGIAAAPARATRSAVPSAPDRAANHAAPNAAKNTFTLWLTAGLGRVLKAMELNLRDFQADQQTYGVALTLMPEGNYNSAIDVAGKTGDLPCLMFIDGVTVPRFAWQGYLQPLDRFLTKELREDMLPSILTQGTIKGRLYSLGLYDSGLGIFAHRKYLRAARLRIPTVAQPWTVSEFESALTKLAALPGIEYPLDLKINYGRGEFFTFAFSPILQSAGGDLIDRRTLQSAKGVLDGPQSVAAMTRFQRWFRKGWANPRPTDDNAFTSGKSALSWVGHWSYLRYAKALGDDLVLLPLPDFGRGPKTGSGSWAFAIASSCRDPAGAWELVRYCLRRDKLLRLAALHPGMPARKSALAQSPLHQPGGPLNLYVQQSLRGWPVLRPRTPAYTTITDAFAEAVDGIVNGADVRQSLTRAARKIDDDIDAHRGYQ